MVVQWTIVTTRLGETVFTDAQWRFSFNKSYIFGPKMADKLAPAVTKVWDIIWQHFQHIFVTCVFALRDVYSMLCYWIISNL